MNIYKNEGDFQKDGKHKYSFSLKEAKIIKISENEKEVKIEVILLKHSYKFQLSPSLWILLSEHHSDITADTDGDTPCIEEEKQTKNESKAPILSAICV